jgi:branched-chain amino acid transport system permease protein
MSKRSLRTAASFLLLTALLVGFAFFPGLSASVKVYMLTAGALCSLSAYLPLMSGQLSLASPAFYLIGGYATGMVSVLWVRLDDETGYWKLPLGFTELTFASELYPWQLLVLEFVLGVIVSIGVGLLVGLLALRLQGIYLALVTIGTVQILNIFVLQSQIGPFKGPLDPLDPSGQTHLGPFGGATGLPGPISPDGMPQVFDKDWQYLYVAVPLVIFGAWLVYKVERGRAGRALMAIREDELAASAMGIRPKYYKMLAFVLSAVLASLAGTLYAHVQNAWSYRQATFALATAMLAGAVVGGSRSFLGPIVGGMVITGLFEALRAIGGIDGLSPSMRDILLNISPGVQGLVMALVCIFLARGLIPPSVTHWLFPKDTSDPQPTLNDGPGFGSSAAALAQQPLAQQPLAQQPVEVAP